MKIAVECTNIYLAEITRTWKASFRTQYRPKTCINIMKIDFWQSVVWIPFSMESNKHNTIPQSIGPWMSSFICMTLAKYLSQKSTCWSDVMFGIVCLFVVCVSVGRGGGGGRGVTWTWIWVCVCGEDQANPKKDLTLFIRCKYWSFSIVIVVYLYVFYNHIVFMAEMNFQKYEIHESGYDDVYLGYASFWRVKSF